MSQANNDQPPSSHTYVLSGGGNMHNNVPGGTYVTIVPANQQLHSPPQIGARAQLAAITHLQYKLPTIYWFHRHRNSSRHL
jgi:hypothetical protein